MAFNIPHMSSYKRGSNQYETKFRFLKRNTWLSIAIIMLVMLILVAVAFLLGQYAKKLSMLEHIPQTVFTYKHSGPAAPTPIPTKRDIVLSVHHSDIVLRIWNNESSEGKQPFLYCQKRGLVNDMGFGVLNTPPICFKTFQEEVSRVDGWFDDMLKTHTLAQSLSIYSGNGKEYIASFLNQ